MGDLIDIQVLLKEKAAQEKAAEEIAIEYEKEQLREHLRYVIDRLAELEPGFKEELRHYHRVPMEPTVPTLDPPADQKKQGWLQQILARIDALKKPSD